MAMSSKPLHQSAQNPIAEATTMDRVDASFELGGGHNAGKNFAWNISFNGTTMPGPLMDMDTKIWPVLSKPVLNALKSSSVDAQVTRTTSISHNSNSTTNHVPPYDQDSTPNHVPYQKSMRHGSGDLPGHDHPSPQRIAGPHLRNNVSRYHSYHSGYHGGGKRGDQDRRKNTNFIDKDSNFQRASFHGPPFPVCGQYMLPGRPVGPFSYHDMPVYSAPLYPGPYPELYRPFRPSQPMAPVLHPYLDPELNGRILQQIEYYFSNDNLASTTHLRENMDAQGWVSINLIAGFKKVMQLTNNIQLILDVLRVSTVVEVEGNKVRRRNDWKKWLLPPSFSGSTLSSSRSSEDMLSVNLQRS